MADSLSDRNSDDFSYWMYLCDLPGMSFYAAVEHLADFLGINAFAFSESSIPHSSDQTYPIDAIPRFAGSVIRMLAHIECNDVTIETSEGFYRFTRGYSTTGDGLPSLRIIT